MLILYLLYATSAFETCRFYVKNQHKQTVNSVTRHRWLCREKKISKNLRKKIIQKFLDIETAAIFIITQTLLMKSNTKHTFFK